MKQHHDSRRSHLFIFCNYSNLGLLKFDRVLTRSTGIAMVLASEWRVYSISLSSAEECREPLGRFRLSKIAVKPYLAQHIILSLAVYLKTIGLWDVTELDNGYRSTHYPTGNCSILRLKFFETNV